MLVGDTCASARATQTPDSVNESPTIKENDKPSLVCWERAKNLLRPFLIRLKNLPFWLLAGLAYWPAKDLRKFVADYIYVTPLLLCKAASNYDLKMNQKIVGPHKKEPILNSKFK